jgi:hypothetical protein
MNKVIKISEMKWQEIPGKRTEISKKNEKMKNKFEAEVVIEETLNASEIVEDFLLESITETVGETQPNEIRGDPHSSGRKVVSVFRLKLLEAQLQENLSEYASDSLDRKFEKVFRF